MKIIYRNAPEFIKVDFFCELKYLNYRHLYSLIGIILQFWNSSLVLMCNMLLLCNGTMTDPLYES